MTYTLPAGRLVKVEIEICIPVAATTAQVEEWVKSCAIGGSIRTDNPLYPHELESFNGSAMLTDTRMQGRREEFDHQPTENGGTAYRVRYVRTPA